MEQKLMFEEFTQIIDQLFVLKVVYLKLPAKKTSYIYILLFKLQLE